MQPQPKTATVEPSVIYSEDVRTRRRAEQTDALLLDHSTPGGGDAATEEAGLLEWSFFRDGDN
jgi:hypothetical protein